MADASAISLQNRNLCRVGCVKFTQLGVGFTGMKIFLRLWPGWLKIPVYVKTVWSFRF